MNTWTVLPSLDLGLTEASHSWTFQMFDGFENTEWLWIWEGRGGIIRTRKDWLPTCWDSHAPLSCHSFHCWDQLHVHFIYTAINRLSSSRWQFLPKKKKEYEEIQENALLFGWNLIRDLIPVSLIAHKAWIVDTNRVCPRRYLTQPFSMHTSFSNLTENTSALNLKLRNSESNCCPWNSLYYSFLIFL